MSLAHDLPPLPELGHSESWYARQIQRADQRRDEHAHAGFKVGQYVTLAMDRSLEWEQKLRYFQHALRRHCVPPPLATETVWYYYAHLADLVRQQAGLEALRLASMEDDEYARRLAMGGTRERIESEARAFFVRLMGDRDTRLDHFNQEDWDQLRLIRSQWLADGNEMGR